MQSSICVNARPDPQFDLQKEMKNFETVSWLKATDFILPLHQTIFAFLSELYESGQSGDSQSIRTMLIDRGIDARELKAFKVTSAKMDFIESARLIHLNSVRRDLVKGGQFFIQAARRTSGVKDEKLKSAIIECHRALQRLQEFGD